ncbi:MAG: DNA repair protein RadC [Flavobacteriia bacterium]|nr:DNA repair protein RadC [Flavobacteriia bacterium]
MSYSKIGIKSWSVADRPREKYKRLGGQKLTDAELLAIVISNGYKGQSALLLAKTILKASDHNLHTLFEMPLDALMQFKGIGLAKAIQIKAALDMGHRSVSLGPANRKVIGSSAAAYAQFKAVLVGLDHEEFWMLYLNNANAVLELSVIGRGGFTATLVDIRLLLRKAIQLGAIGLIAAHNHPSGTLRPSEQDRKLTEKLKVAAASIDIKLLDHLIVGRGEYFSFADQDLL